MQNTDKWYFETGKIYDTCYINTTNYIGQITEIHDENDVADTEHVYEIRYQDFDSWIVLPYEYTPQQIIDELLQQIQFDLDTVYVRIQPNYVNA